MHEAERASGVARFRRREKAQVFSRMIRDAAQEAGTSASAPPTAHAGRLSYLDGWRGFSILMVLLAHFVMHEDVGFIGVQMFFALSGRLMADILFAERFPLKEFYKRRFARIYPGLFVFVLLAYFLL